MFGWQRIALTLGYALGLSAALASSPPNVLVIMSDEHNASVLGCYGNKLIRSPNLDRLASKGVVFDAAYTNSPLCVPCRQSFTAGKYISRINAWNNNCKIPADSPSIARVMNAAGYESILCGKMHYDRDCRYGFTEIGGNMNTNRMRGGGGHRRKPEQVGPSEQKSGRLELYRPNETSSIIEHDQKVTSGTVEFLKNRKATDKPFFMIAGYLAPHFPLDVPERYWLNYKDKVPMPVIPDGYLDMLPLNYKHLRAGFKVNNVDPALVKLNRELYYGLTEWVDNEIGKVLAALDVAGLGDKTVVIYTTDHGENMGEHGLWWKNCMFDTAARVPLIISYPKRWKGGQRRSAACSLVDVVQTIARMGGTRVPEDWDGDSLIPYLDDPDYAWKDVAISEYHGHNIASGISMIRKGAYKYVYHAPANEKYPAERELYDLAKDPGELVNLASRPEQKQRMADMHVMLVKKLGEEPDAIERRYRKNEKRPVHSSSQPNDGE